MRRMTQLANAAGLFIFCALAYAGPPVEGVMEKQATNWHAIIMFCAFVALSMGITYWASNRTKSWLTSIRPVAVSPVSKTAWPLPVTICQPLRFSA